MVGRVTWRRFQVTSEELDTISTDHQNKPMEASKNLHSYHRWYTDQYGFSDHSYRPVCQSAQEDPERQNDSWSWLRVDSDCPEYIRQLSTDRKSYFKPQQLSCLIHKVISSSLNTIIIPVVENRAVEFTIEYVENVCTPTFCWKVVTSVWLPKIKYAMLYQCLVEENVDLLRRKWLFAV